VVKLLGDLEPQGKMARLLVEIRDPLSIEREGDGGDLPLLLGAYVNVDIEGPALTDVIALPRPALRDNDQVWLKREGKLVIREVDVVWTTEDKVFVRGDLSTDSDVVISRIDAPVEGMPLRLNGEKPAAVAAGDAGPTRSSGSASSGAAQ